jgi:hypothetical protein
MKTVKYVGNSHVRELTMADISKAFGIDAPSDIVAVKGEPFEVSNRLADALARMDPVEFHIVDVGEQDEAEGMPLIDRDEAKKLADEHADEAKAAEKAAAKEAKAKANG